MGSTPHRGEPNYHVYLDTNLFLRLTTPQRRSYREGNVNELNGKMKATHSSSCMTANPLGLWFASGRADAVAVALGGTPGVERACFELQLPILDTRPPANLDAALISAGGSAALGVEAKFTEPLGRAPNGLKAVYLAERHLWHDAPNVLGLARSLSPDNRSFISHVCQIVKYDLTLWCRFRTWSLVDLVYDHGIPELDIEWREIEAVFRADGWAVSRVTVQDYIGRMSDACVAELDHEWLGYCRARYGDRLEERPV